MTTRNRKALREVHANAVLADGHVDSAEEHVVRPMTRLEAKTKALKDAMKELEEATKDGELTQDEIDALHKAYDGYGKYMKKLLDGKIQKEQERLEKEKAEGGDANLSNRIDEQETEEHLASADTETGGFWGARGRRFLRRGHRCFRQIRKPAVRSRRVLRTEWNV